MLKMSFMGKNGSKIHVSVKVKPRYYSYCNGNPILVQEAQLS